MTVLRWCWLAVIASLFFAQPAVAQDSSLDFLTAAQSSTGEKWSLSIETFVLLLSLSFLPAAILMMTSFTRIIIVLGLLRTAIGTPTTPPNQVLLGITLFLTIFVMSPILSEIRETAWDPLTQEQIDFKEAARRASIPMREFMLAQTRQKDIGTFAEIAGISNLQTEDDLPLPVLTAAFVTSELKTAFQIGFTIFVPFLIIDLAVASILMGLGMMMVPPVTVSLPFKLMLFVMIDGWSLIMGSLSGSFFVP